jgi:hypothetical protein
MPGFIKGVEDLRAIEWDAGYLWDIKFIENPSHKSQLSGAFKDWFPASTVNDERFSLTEHTFDLHQFGGVPFPNGASQRSVSITFFDDVHNTLLNWVSLWVKTDILNDGKYLTPLSRCTKRIHIVKLNSQREQLKSFIYQVIPSGMMDFQGTEHSDSTLHTLVLRIVGESNT